LSACAIIVTYRTGPALARCLASVRAASGINEIILVDNGNDDPEVRAMDAAASDRRVRIIRGHGNVGFAAACNLGAAQAREDVLAFINPDATLAPDAIMQLTQALTAAPPPAIVGGDLRDASGRTERGARRERLTLWRAFVSFTGLSRLERFSPALRDFNRHRDPLPAAPIRTSAVSGALLCIRRTDLATLGGFDEGYFLHVEDVDLCRRAEEAGWPILFVPGPHGAHAGATSAAPAAEVARHKARGFARYFRKFARSPIEQMLAAGVGAVLLVLLPLIARR
jgi:N-acetylglucosaminyl-diphospho-decaprenol L-rhamnosyltransferase